MPCRFVSSRAGWRKGALAAGVGLLLLTGVASRALADENDEDEAPSAPAGSPAAGSRPQTTGPKSPAFGPGVSERAEGFWERENLFGDLGGLRPRLAAVGVRLGLEEQSEVLGNVAGGLHRGVAYDGATQVSLALDLGKAFGLAGTTAFVSAYHIHGRGPSTLVGSLQAVSSIEAARSTRLYELWLEQALLGGRLSVRVGQQAIDEEFLSSTYAGLFINSSFRFPALATLDLPSGGPSYPLATPAVRLRIRADERLTVLAAVFNGNPAGPGTDDPERRDASGTTFRVNDGALAIVEAQLAVNGQSSTPGLPGTYKLGAWYLSSRDQDASYDARESRLGARPTAGLRSRRDDYSVYAIADQMVWRRPGTTNQGIGLFARVMGAPGGRNLVNLSVDGGVSWKGIVPGREDDTAGLAVTYARVGAAARRLDLATRDALGGAYPTRDGETVLEATYSLQAAGWWEVQPDLQHVFRPGGGILTAAGRKVRGATIIGLRTAVTF